MLFLCAATMGVDPWRVLLPRSTKTAATVLVQVYSVRRTSGAPMRLSNCGLPAAKRTAKQAAVPRRGAPVVWKSSPRSTSLRNLKDFGQLALRDGYFTKQQITKNSGASPLTTSQRLPGVAWIISRPARGENAIAEGTPRAPKALQ